MTCTTTTATATDTTPVYSIKLEDGTYGNITYATSGTLTTFSPEPSSVRAIKADSNSFSVNYDSFCSKMKDFFVIKEYVPQSIEEIVEYVPYKVYEIRFNNGKKVKTICDEEDTFDPEYMFYLAIAKMMYSKTHTFEGVIMKSHHMRYEKKYNKIVKQGLQMFKKLREENDKKEEEKILKKQQREKFIKKKKAAKARKRQDLINIIAEAIQLSKEEG